jgi:hypothetical protein
MTRAMSFLLMAFVWSGGFEARAMFMWHQTRQVPIERLFTNLQERLARDTNDFETTYDLARLHAMAYSTNLSVLNVRTNDGRPQFYFPVRDSGVPAHVHPPPTPEARAQALRHLTNAVELYERAIVLLKTSPKTASQKSWLVLPLELGHAWCLDQIGSRQAALAAYRKTLELAWRKEVTGDFSFSEWVQEKWKAVKSGRNPLKPMRRGYIGPGVCFSQETIGYMLQRLDPVKDADEIADLTERKKVLRSMGRAITPLVVPLTEETQLSRLVNREAAVAFDLDGSGWPRRWGWITPKAAWLVFDPEGHGRITSGLQMFGNVTFWIFWRDGYAALRSLDDDHNGTLQGTELRGMALWQDLNANGVSEPGEVRSVVEWGIRSISCAGETDHSGVPWCPTGVTLDDGRTRPTYDWIAPSEPEVK